MSHDHAATPVRHDLPAAEIDAVAEAMWDARDARMGGPWAQVDRDTVAAVQTRATAAAVIRALDAERGHQLTWPLRGAVAPTREMIEAGADVIFTGDFDLDDCGDEAAGIVWNAMAARAPDFGGFAPALIHWQLAEDGSEVAETELGTYTVAAVADDQPLATLAFPDGRKLVFISTQEARGQAEVDYRERLLRLFVVVDASGLPAISRRGSLLDEIERVKEAVALLVSKAEGDGRFAADYHGASLDQRERS